MRFAALMIAAALAPGWALASEPAPCVGFLGDAQKADGLAVKVEAKPGGLHGAASLAGLPPKVKTPKLPRDKACAVEPADLPSINKGPGLERVLVWLEGVSAPKPEHVKVKLDVERCVLRPRIRLTTVGEKAEVNNYDAKPWTLKLTHGKDVAELALKPNQKGEHAPTKEPRLLRITAEGAPWLTSYLAVLPHGFGALTDASGQFDFEGVPPGSYTLCAWHESIGYAAQKVEVAK